jgi:hypothetical protein
MIVVVPSIWEWDDVGPSPEEQLWDSSIRRMVEARRSDFISLISAWPARQSLVNLIAGPACRNVGTRPISSGRLPGFFQLEHRALMNIPVVRVSLASARHAFATPLTDSIVTYSEGNLRSAVESGVMPRGVIPIHITDSEELKGDYTLYIQIEQM